MENWFSNSKLLLCYRSLCHFLCILRKCFYSWRSHLGKCETCSFGAIVVFSTATVLWWDTVMTIWSWCYLWFYMSWKTGSISVTSLFTNRPTAYLSYGTMWAGTLVNLPAHLKDMYFVYLSKVLETCFDAEIGNGFWVRQTIDLDKVACRGSWMPRVNEVLGCPGAGQIPKFSFVLKKIYIFRKKFNLKKFDSFPKTDDDQN